MSKRLNILASLLLLLALLAGKAEVQTVWLDVSAAGATRTSASMSGLPLDEVGLIPSQGLPRTADMQRRARDADAAPTIVALPGDKAVQAAAGSHPPGVWRVIGLSPFGRPDGEDLVLGQSRQPRAPPASSISA